MGAQTPRPAGMEHIPRYPRGFLVLRVLQLIGSFICLGLSAYGIAVLVLPGNGLMLFTVSKTIPSSPGKQKEDNVNQ